ncbi:transcription factor IBH1-like 1 [Panicum virgatum]|uniref:IBH1-like N-terminal domain-containing protein n=1 Tax=Panicum virgatum TaxID=38727 RepID=A0A8T0XT18_PANVG|nr:transcription factor IBH1-like 1 [Panicum virgatum]XP_039777168.1 transcription factor IBH1-like 1 [Panicum virgatum]KAG2662165.1 hypothetical protein PVAP13_1KG530900 [Panicum virgatum]
MSSPSSSLQGIPPGSKRFRHAILKNLILVLRKGASRGMGIHERRSAIRRAADAALATARGAAPRWSRSLAAELSQGGGRDAHLLIRAAKSSAPSSSECKSPAGKMVCSKRMPRRRLRARPKSRATAKAAGVLARVLVRKRARALREIVPGGRGMMDECTLLGETLDYAVSLKDQVEAMQLLLRTLQAPQEP